MRDNDLQVWTAIGGKSQLAGFITAWLVALCLGVATGAFKYIPNNTLAAITIYGLVGLFDGQHLIYLWKVKLSSHTFLCLVNLALGS